MIKNIFIPEVVNGYYPIAHRILGISITTHSISAVQIKLHARTTTIEKTWDEWLVQNGETSLQERVSTILATIVGQAQYDELRTSLPSNNIIFKELTLPFLDREQLDLVVRYEVEPLLPFSLQDTTIDFIITAQDMTAKTSTIMVAAVPNAVIKEHLELYTASGIEPTVITIDMFDVYSLYTLTTSPDKEISVGLTAIDMQTTTIGYSVNNQLKLIRVIPQGLMHFAKKISSTTGITLQQSVEELMRFGMVNTEDPQYTETMSTVLRQFARELQFTFESFATQHQTTTANLKIFILGIGATIPDFAAALSTHMPYPCSIIDLAALLKADNIVLEKNIALHIDHIPALGAAIPTRQTEEFNLKKGIFVASEATEILKPVVIAGVLLLSIFGLLLYHTYQQKSMLLSAKKSLSNEVLSHLKEENLVEPDTFSLPDALNEAQDKITQEEEIWFAFSSQTRFSMLKNLQALSAAIDREGVQLKLERIELTENSISIKGSVPGYPNLKRLEKELEKSDLFVSVPALQELEFDETLQLKHKNGGRS